MSRESYKFEDGYIQVTQGAVKIKSSTVSFSQKNYDGDTSALIIGQNKVLVYVKGQSFALRCPDDLTC